MVRFLLNHYEKKTVACLMAPTAFSYDICHAAFPQLQQRRRNIGDHRSEAATGSRHHYFSRAWSVVQAGLLLLPRREQPQANTWDAVSITPGHDPLFAVKFERSRPIKG